MGLPKHDGCGFPRRINRAVALHYLRYGDTEHDKIIAKLPLHTPGSIRMALDNFKALDGDGGLTHASKQQRDVWAFVSAVRDRAAFAALVLEAMNR